jgi:DNA-binding NtrC family response regulator
MDKKHKILIIDDSNETVAGLKNLLDGKYNTVTAGDGLEGLKAYENDRDGIDLIITDLVMPAISGVTLINVIKGKCPKMPIIAITGWGHHPKALASEAKADLILDKPFEMDDLYQSITKLLATKV